MQITELGLWTGNHLFCEFTSVHLHQLKGMQSQHKLCMRKGYHLSTGHFRVPKTLTFKMRPSAQPFLWKWVLFAWEWKFILISKVERLTSFLFRGPGKRVSNWSVIWDCTYMKGPNDAFRRILWARIAKKPRPQPDLVIYSYLKYETFTALKKILNRLLKGF